MSSAPPVIYKAVLGIDLGIYVGEPMTDPTERLIHISQPQLELSTETEEMDILATGLYNAYVDGNMELGITFTMRRFTADGKDPADTKIIRNAFRTRTPISVRAEDTAAGTILWDYKVTKMSENREKSKVVSWSVELKPTYIGRGPEFTDPTETTP